MLQDEIVARNQVRNFIIDNMDAFYDDSELKDFDNIFEKGYVSSIFAMQLLNFIEKEFNIVVLDEYIRLENFSSIDNIMKLANKLIGGS